MNVQRILGLFAAASAATAIAVALAAPAPAPHDLVLRGGTIYDGSGDKPYVGDVAIDGDRITYVGPPRTLAGRTVLDVHGSGGGAGIYQHARPSGGILPDRRARAERPDAGRDAGSAGRGFDGSADAADAAADGAAPGRHQVSGDLDDAGPVPGDARTPRHQSQRGLFRGRTGGAHLCARRGRRAAERGSARADARARAPGHGRGRAGPDHHAHLRPGHLRQDAGTHRTRPGVGALRGHLYRPHAQRRRPHRSGHAGDHRHRPRQRRAGRDLSPQGGRAGTTGASSTA